MGASYQFCDHQTKCWYIFNRRIHACKRTRSKLVSYRNKANLSDLLTEKVVPQISSRIFPYLSFFGSVQVDTSSASLYRKCCVMNSKAGRPTTLGRFSGVAISSDRRNHAVANALRMPVS